MNERPYLIHETDWSCMDEGDGIEAHLDHWALIEAPIPEREPAAWLKLALKANPGAWIAQICRGRSAGMLPQKDRLPLKFHEFGKCEFGFCICTNIFQKKYG